MRLQSVSRVVLGLGVSPRWAALRALPAALASIATEEPLRVQHAAEESTVMEPEMSLLARIAARASFPHQLLARVAAVWLEPFPPPDPLLVASALRASSQPAISPLLAHHV